MHCTVLGKKEESMRDNQSLLLSYWLQLFLLLTNTVQLYFLIVIILF